MRPGFRCRPSFFFFFLRSVTNRRLVSRAHASLVHAYGTWNLQKLSSWKARSDSTNSRAIKSHTTEYTVRGRPTLKVVKQTFSEGVGLQGLERSTICEQTFWVNLSRIMLYQMQRSCQPGLSTLQLDKKHLQKRHRIFRRDREPSIIPTRTHNVWAIRAERLENLFLLFTNVSVWVHLSKTLWETS